MIRVRPARAVVPFAAALLLVLAGCSAATNDATSSSSESADTAARPRLLAIGDSITFAWDPHVESDITRVDPTNYSGYAELLGEQLGLTVDNAACPGETSGAMLDAHAEDNGCRTNRATYALHYPWPKAGGSPATQMDFAAEYLKHAVAAGNAPEIVTMTIGGNDLLVLQKHCQLPGPLAAACKLARLPFYVHAYGANVEKIALDLDAAGYKGAFVLISTYAPDYSDPIATFALGQMNGEVREHLDGLQGKLHGMTVHIADGYGAFKAEADQHGGKTCETGLLIKNDDGTCDIHPTAAGHAALAGAVKAALGR